MQGLHKHKKGKRGYSQKPAVIEDGEEKLYIERSERSLPMPRTMSLKVFCGFHHHYSQNTIDRLPDPNSR